MKFLLRPLAAALSAALLLTSCARQEAAPTPLAAAAIGQNVAAAGFPETFETGTKTAYASGTVALSSGSWTLDDALLGNTTADVKTGTQSVRLRNSGTLTMNFNLSSGAGVVTIDHARYGTDPATTAARRTRRWAAPSRPVALRSPRPASP
jgi:hypothetical protein